MAILRELGDRGSVTAVAAALYITPSAVSQQPAALQRTVPVPLTRRDGRRLALTEAGTALAAAAAGVASALAAAEQTVAGYLDASPQPVHVAAFDSAASAFFPSLVARAAAEGVDVRCTDQDVAQERFPALCADHDVVLAHRPLHGPPWPPTVAVTPLLREPLDVALPRDHPLSERDEPLTAADVADEPWIAVHQGFPLAASLDAVAAAASRPVRVVHRLNGFPVAVALVAEGQGCALVPRWTGPAHPGVVLRPLADVRIGRHVEALARPDRVLRTTVGRVVVLLRDVAADLSRPT
ncbi:LysR family transcriptional regulator [Angustibacter aerolatus]|uniref:LysR family transcriptional regulator n=1 Tax=Angustibacter aerolatus TaxID=1162965 RepID=A0ABQ6JB61_9ACTN|nr:LysR family transcriptional regulator [Angustibacter aerolatus]GMA84826.1 LysR family transcriptional regulator [Angustibacter aerolatus]